MTGFQFRDCTKLTSSWDRSAAGAVLGFFAKMLRLTITTLVLDIETEWTLNASLTKSSKSRKCSKRQILDHSVQATSLLQIESTTKCSRIARGFGSVRILGFVADLNPRPFG